MPARCANQKKILDSDLFFGILKIGWCSFCCKNGVRWLFKSGKVFGEGQSAPAEFCFIDAVTGCIGSAAAFHPGATRWWWVQRNGGLVRGSGVVYSVKFVASHRRTWSRKRPAL